MTSRKLLAAILASALLFVGAEAVLASIPHSHGNDFDHSHHGACPVHQLGLHGLHLSTVSADVPAAVPHAFFVSRKNSPQPPTLIVLNATSRAPPAAV
jgi:hypothetical protein